jgi:hypothetical protein
VAGACALVLAAACAPAHSAGTDGEITRYTRSDRRNALTPEELRAQPEVRTAYDAVQRWRPEWLRVSAAQIQPNRCLAGGCRMQTPAVVGQILVFRDRTRLGTVNALHEIPITSVREMRYLNAEDARALLPLSDMGPGSVAGAVVVLPNS